MNHSKFFTIAAIPIILFVISYFQNKAFDKITHISDHAEYLEVPDYIYTSEFRLIIEKTYLDIYNSSITDSMRNDNAIWLGYCNEDLNSLSCSQLSTSKLKCGDKIRWGGRTFCISW